MNAQTNPKSEIDDRARGSGGGASRVLGGALVSTGLTIAALVAILTLVGGFGGVRTLQLDAVTARQWLFSGLCIAGLVAAGWLTYRQRTLGYVLALACVIGIPVGSSMVLGSSLGLVSIGGIGIGVALVVRAWMTRPHRP